jgi:hypothetical protein
MRPSLSQSTLAALAIALGASACHSEPPPQGPAEKAGAKVDHAADDTKDAVKDTAHDVKKDADK